MEPIDENNTNALPPIGPENSDEHIVLLIQNGEWQEVIVSLTHDMNPWDIDLVQLNKRFMDQIKKAHELDLLIPSKILLAAAIIYRLKSDTLRYAEEEAATDIGAIDENVEYTPLPYTADPDNPIVIPPIQIPLRRMPKRAVCIDELVDALGKAMVIKDRRESRTIFQIDLNGEDITKSIEDLFDKINKFLETNNLVNFGQLFFEKPTREQKLRTFSSLLHLSNQGRVVCEQLEMFGEISIKLVQNGARERETFDG